MKFGVRKPSIKRSISARTTGKAKRQLKKQLYLATAKKALDGLRIRRKPHIIKCIKKLRLAFGIYLNSKKHPPQPPKAVEGVCF